MHSQLFKLSGLCVHVYGNLNLSIYVLQEETDTQWTIM